MPYHFSNDGLHSIELIKELGDPFLIQSMISSFFHYDGIQFSELVDLAFLKSLARDKNLFAFSVCFFYSASFGTLLAKIFKRNFWQCTSIIKAKWL